jgi:hypothetical protein
MKLREAARGNGLVLIASVLGTIALLVFGLGISSWFTAEQAVIETGAGGAFGHATTEISPATIEVCSYGRCVSAWTLELADSSFAKLAAATLLLGIAFGLLVLWFANRRIAAAEVPWLLKWAGHALALSVIATAALCLFVHTPGVVAYEIVAAGDPFVPDWPGEHTRAITKPPARGLGGFLTIAGVLLGGFVVWGARSPERAKAPEEKRRPRARRETRPPAHRGPETDPFRSPPRPQLAVVRHERPAATPVDADPSQEPPKLLR